MKHVTLKLRMTAIAVLFAFCAMMMVPADAVAATHQSQTMNAYVQGTNATGDVFNGVVQITSFADQGGQLVANGLLNGTLTPAGGQPTPITNLPVTLPVSSVSGGCQILNLVLGPLNVDLLGLVITLNQVHLNITAVPGGGQLLGNLLCAVANLLNGTNLSGVLDQLVTLLNQILAAL